MCQYAPVRPGWSSAVSLPFPRAHQRLLFSTANRKCCGVWYQHRLASSWSSASTGLSRASWSRRRARIDGPEPAPGAYIVPVWEAPGQPMLPLGFIPRRHGRTRSRTLRLAGASRRRRMPPVGHLLRRNPHHDHVHRTALRRTTPAVPVIITPTAGMRRPTTPG